MSDKNLLNVKDLYVDVEDKEILHGVNLSIGKGETHVLMGPNGTGKSTLGYALMGNPRYTVKSGEIWFDGKNITDEPVNERAKAGMFLSFQNPLEVPGVTLSSFIRNALELKTGKRTRYMEFKKELEKTMELLSMDKSYAERDLNVGFSGGEKKKAEILQLLMLKPSFAILDETDSGLDVDAVKTVSAGIEEYQKTCKGSLLIITHSTRILESLSVDYTHVMIEGKIISTGDASLVDKINENGFAEYESRIVSHNHTLIYERSLHRIMKEKTYVDDIDRNIYDFKNDDKDTYKLNAGLTPEIVEKLSKEKNDPAWMQNFRLESLQIYNNMKVPNWGPSIEGLNMDNIVTYVRPNTNMKAKWSEVPEDIKDTFEKLGIPQAERSHLLVLEHSTIQSLCITM